MRAVYAFAVKKYGISRPKVASLPPSHCIGALKMLRSKFYNFLIGRKCLGALVLSKTRQTGLGNIKMMIEFVTPKCTSLFLVNKHQAVRWTIFLRVSCVINHGAINCQTIPVFIV